MATTLTPHMRVDIKVENIANTLNQYIDQLKSLSPYLKVYRGKGDPYGHGDPSGLLERISDRVYWSVKANNVIGDWYQPFYCKEDGIYDHKRVQFFLEEMYNSLRSRRFTTVIGLYRFYIELRKGLLILRRDGY